MRLNTGFDRGNVAFAHTWWVFIYGDRHRGEVGIEGNSSNISYV